MTSERRGLPRIGSHLDCIQKLARSMTYDVAAAKVLEWLDERATGGHPDHRQPDERFRKSADIIRLQAVDLTALRAERDSLAAQLGQAKLVIEGEQEARWKLEAAYRMKDEAVGKLMALCQKRGIDLSELIP